VLTAPLVASIFLKRAAAPLHLLVQGTNFQLKVWEALLRIPPGMVTSYGNLAERIGKTGAARTVGRAVAENPIAFIIPCHRVIRETGAIHGYEWGIARKRAMLAWEAARFGAKEGEPRASGLENRAMEEGREHGRALSGRL